MSSETRIPVLIIGGGIVGLSASLFLSHQGIKSIVIERHSGTSIHPRARSVNARTMELFRHLGIDGRVKEAGASLSPTMGIYSGHSLREVIEPKPLREEKKKMPFGGLAESIGPMRGAWVTQDMIEPVLVDAARGHGGEVRFYTECISVSQDEKGATAVLKDRNTGETSEIHADYLIAADGARSPIRTALKIPTTGQGAMGHLLNILFEADLKSLVHHREFSLCKIARPEVSGLFTSINNSNKWVFHMCYSPPKAESPADFPPEKCVELLRLALGFPDIDINIKSILPWEPSVQVAERLQEGRIFLAGDAAHQMPPWGGQGANSGIADVHNLAWKLVAVLNGHANSSLLETYNIERLPVGREAAEASAQGADEQGLISVKMSLPVIRGWIRRIPIISGHGYGYTSRAISDEDTSPLGGWTWRPWTLPSLGFAIDGRPGRRVPHVWVEKEDKKISTLDLCGKGFVMFAGSEGKSWEDAAEAVCLSLGLSISAYCVGPNRDLVVENGDFETAAGISATGAILVRPDDFVVWRERRRSGDDRKSLEDAMRRALCIQ